MFDLLSIYEMKEDIANNAAAIAEFHPDTTTTTTKSTNHFQSEKVKNF